MKNKPQQSGTAVAILALGAAMLAPTAHAHDGHMDTIPVLPLTAPPKPRPTLSETEVSFGGFVKLDAMYSRYDAGDPGPTGLLRDFYVPGAVPVGGIKSSSSDFHAKETRFWLDAVHVLSDLTELKAHIEMDFQVSPGGNERVSNSYNPRMRQAFFTAGNWTVGQAWSTFQDVSALAENLDFIGPAEGTVFVRQPLIRYNWHGLELALENPETTVTPNGGGARAVAGDNGFPDFVARYKHKMGKGHLSAATLVRQLAYNDGSSVSNSSVGFGLSVSGKLPIGDRGTDLRFMLTGGEGIGRYVGVNTANDAVVAADDTLEAIGVAAGFVSLRLPINSDLRMNLTGSAFMADNDTALTGTGVTSDVWSMHANLIYDWLPKVSVGAEYMFAHRKLESGADGEMDRLQFSAKFSF